jgi:hypothetical protein
MYSNYGTIPKINPFNPIELKSVLTYINYKKIRLIKEVESDEEKNIGQRLPAGP